MTNLADLILLTAQFDFGRAYATKKGAKVDADTKAGRFQWLKSYGRAFVLKTVFEVNAAKAAQ